MRRYWIDNLRWVTVLLVLLYHVIYFYNNKGVIGGVGGFGDGPQYQDVVMYVLYPWFMPLLFMLAGISARYALESRSGKAWFKSRTRKLLVPATIGLFVFQWMVGFFNTHVSGMDVLADVPQPAKYIGWSLNGTGPLWFIQMLWVLCLVLLLVRKLDVQNRFWNWCGKANIVMILLLGILFWLGLQTLITLPATMMPDAKTGLTSLYNLYKPFFYLVTFLLGYFVFSHDEVQEKLQKAWMPLMACAVVAGVTLVVNTFGENNTTPEYLGSPLNAVFGWLMCLAMMGWFKARFDATGRFAAYMTRSSFGIYVVHYLFIAGIGYLLKYHTELPPVAMYLILTVAVFTLSPLTYEALRRIPIIKWCVLGESHKRSPK